MSSFAHVGKVIDGHYKLHAPVGAGNMGAVYVAQAEGGPYVALKLVLDVDESLRARDRFVREVQTLNRVDHPNVVQLLDAGVDPDLSAPYLVMELVMGDSLARLSSRGRMPANFVLHVARQVCLGMHAAHEQGIVHRDLKPGNIMVFPKDGRVLVKVLDFGLAWVRNADTRLTKTGTMPGTVSYMAPETLRGDAIDERTDLYGLGCIMFELLTGQLPFPGENATRIGMMHLTTRPPKARKLVNDIPKEVEQFVQRLMAKKPAERPQTARETAEEIAAIQAALSMEEPRVKHSAPSREPEKDWGIIPIH